VPRWLSRSLSARCAVHYTRLQLSAALRLFRMFTLWPTALLCKKLFRQGVPRTIDFMHPILERVYLNASQAMGNACPRYFVDGG